MSATSAWSKIRVGPAGWSYADWHGIVYPQPKPPGFHEAAYLAQFFDTIEINTSFYQPPRADIVRAWLRRVERNPAFMFTAKIWRGFTHERNATLQDEKLFKQGVAPLMEAGRFGALLLQFPWSFKNQRENHEYLGGLFLRFREYPLVLEVRHASWNRPETFNWLAESGVGICNIDQPVIGRSVAPSDRAIPQSGIGYVRLHGRNYEHWFTSNERPEERYNYLYSMAELGPWVERIKSLGQRTDVTYVITNNHYGGKAIANALQLVSLLRGQAVRVPGSLRQHYSELEKIAAPDSLPSEPRQAALTFEPLSAGTNHN